MIRWFRENAARIAMPWRVPGALLVVLFFHATLSAVAAGELAQPTGKVVLTIKGNITNTNHNGAARFDMAMLEKMGGASVITETPWTDKAVRFDGVLVRKLLDAVGGRGETVWAIAINDYKVKIPVADFANHPVILAYRMNGERMRVRDKGPLWVIYPWSDYPELKNERFFARSIWQVKEMELK